MTVEIRCFECRRPNPLTNFLEEGCPSCGARGEIVIDLRDTGRVPGAILVVDDDPQARSVLVDVLGAAGFGSILEAANGPDAIAIAEARHPVVVMLDYLMPAITGEQTARLIRTRSPESAIVSFSALIDKLPEWSDASLPKTEIDRAPELVGLLLSRAAAKAPPTILRRDPTEP